MTREIWRKIKGFSKYRISNLGRIKSVDHYNSPYIDSMGRNMPKKLMKGKIKTQRKHQFGYLVVDLVSDDAKSVHTKTVHKLMCLAFKSKSYFKGAVVRHLDGNPANNTLSNLAWGTQKENAQDAVAHGTVEKGEERYNARLKKKDILMIRSRISQGETFTAVGRDYNLSESRCYGIATGDKWASVGGTLYQKKKTMNKLGEDDRQKVLDLFDKGYSQAELARMFNVSVTQISNIRKGKK